MKKFLKDFLNYMDKLYFGEPRKIKKKLKRFVKNVFTNVIVKTNCTQTDMVFVLVAIAYV